MIQSLLFAFKYIAMGAGAVIKGFAIGLWENPIILIALIAFIGWRIIKQKLSRI